MRKFVAMLAIVVFAWVIMDKSLGGLHIARWYYTVAREDDKSQRDVVRTEDGSFLVGDRVTVEVIKGSFGKRTLIWEGK